jgi:uncharacterized protein (TIGR03118 family)
MYLRRCGLYFSASLFAAIVLSHTATAGNISGFAQTNLVSDINGMAPVTDANLKNPWGVSFTSASPFWISDQVTDVATLYNSTGAKQPLTVSMPNMNSPTGTVSNGTSSFNSDLFLFATLNGTITGWRSALGTTAETLFTAPAGTVYTGLTSATVNNVPLLYAADTAGGKIDVYNTSGKTTVAGNFTDPSLPNGFSPYNVQNIGGSIYVTYAPNVGSAGGLVDVFDLNGNFVKRLITNNGLNSPWGITVAPGGFGPLGGDFLIGNEDEGVINVFDPSGNALGTLASNGSAITNTGLWTLTFGNGGMGGSPGSLYITAGIDDEKDGLFARIDAVPEPGTFSLLALGAIAVIVARRAPQFRRG